MNYGIHSNDNRDNGYEVARKTAEIILSCGGTPVFAKEFEGEFEAPEGTVFENFGKIPLKTIISIGGDGTFLRTVHRFVNESIPIIGVNLGSIGFLTEIQKEDFEDAVDRLLDGKYTLEARSQLDVTLCSEDGTVKEHGLCLNDAVIARGVNMHVVNLDLLIDHDYVERLSGDGVILSTAMGSTAYCLAAGGPIVKPELDVFMVTPICPHTLHNRSYVVSGDSVIEITIGRFSVAPVLSLDGRPNIMLEYHDRIVLKKAVTPVVVAKIGYKNFYQTVRQKIRARGSFYEDGEK